jgi:hypothetical protein
MRAALRSVCSAIVATLFFLPTSFGFATVLSDEAVRDAYFLGQHHDASVVSYLDKYVKHLPPPKTGAYISSIAFFTPFAQLVEFSGRKMGSYSAQQAEQDHRGQKKEFVRIQVEIDLTLTFGPFLSPDELGPKRPNGMVPRSADFWRDFTLQVHDGDRLVDGATLRGSPKYICGDQYGSCNLTGASVQLELPADSFISDTATVIVTAPDNAEISSEFNLNSFR